jgi:aminoglycoside phosphotransferase (APT) family kinase protein
VHQDPETIRIRSDESIDLTRLEPWLRANLPATDGPLTVRQFGGGHANLTYLIAFGDTEYVLRRPPLGPIAPRSHDMSREHLVLSRLGKAFPLAPTSFVLCQDASIIGADFHVLERRQGFAIRKELPPSLRGDIGTVRRLAEMLVDTLAALHQVDTEQVGLSDLGHPDGFVQRQLSGWSKRWHAAKDHDLPDADRLMSWLDKEIPSSQTTSLLHNDYKLDNLLVDTADPATATAVLDWDMCTQGDPLMDLGYLLNVWIEAGDDPSWRENTSMPSYEEGFLTRDEVVDRYARQTGLNVERVRWYYAFGVFKLMVILQQIYIRFLRGQTQDERFRVLGQQVEGLARKGVSVADER